MSNNKSRNYGIIIQAREGSSRLARKMVRPFHEDRTIPQIIIQNIKKHFEKHKIILAIPNKGNEDLAKLAEKEVIPLFRGDENDVLDRFIKAATVNNFDVVVRVCADNPFLRPELIKVMIDKLINEKLDYVSYIFDDGTPAIKSHLGLFVEVTTLEALQRIKKHTNESLFIEHVTNFIYSNENLFKIGYLPLDVTCNKNKELRLTVDTATDFSIVSEIYKTLVEKNANFSTEKLFEHILNSSEYTDTMKLNILNNPK